MATPGRAGASFEVEADLAGVVQLELLGVRSEARYARAIRAHLEANRGFANDRRLILDAKRQP